jgi:hypothetical protein
MCFYAFGFGFGRRLERTFEATAQACARTSQLDLACSRVEDLVQALRDI